VTILHKIHYSIEVPKTKTDYWFSKYNRVLHHYSVSTEVVVAVVWVWVLVAVVGVMVVVAAGMIGV
jgi:G:T-mismatch repair DNA endonuclease (very short patch repair protein)